MFTTGYGALVITKVALLAALAMLGNAARMRLAKGRVPVLRWAALEVTRMTITIGVAAALGQAA